MNLQGNEPVWKKEDLANIISKIHERLKKEALILAINLSETGINKNDLHLHATGIQASYNSLVSRAKQTFQGTTTEKAKSILQEEKTASELRRNTDAIEEKKEKKRIDTSDYRKLYLTFDWSTYKYKVFAELCIFGGEIAYNAMAFTVFGGSILYAIPAAVLFSICLALTAYYLPKWIKERELKRERIRYAIALVLGMFIVFISIGLLRSVIAFGNGSISSIFDNAVLLSALLFTVLNCFMFSAAAALSYYGLPSKEERLIKREYDKLGKQIAKSEKEIYGLEQKNEKLQSNLNMQKQQRIISVGEELHIEQYIHSLSAETLAAFYAEFEIKKPKDGTTLLTGPKTIS